MMKAKARCATQGFNESLWVRWLDDQTLEIVINILSAPKSMLNAFTTIHAFRKKKIDGVIKQYNMSSQEN